MRSTWLSPAHYRDESGIEWLFVKFRKSIGFGRSHKAHPDHFWFHNEHQGPDSKPSRITSELQAAACTFWRGEQDIGADASAIYQLSVRVGALERQLELLRRKISRFERSASRPSEATPD